MDSELIKWAIAGGGWIVALLSVWVGYKERQKFREEERLQQTLLYFTGGTQKRSVGIGLVEGVWKYKSEYMEILIPVISNQIIYLLLTSDTDDEAHEERNLIRMLSLFSRLSFNKPSMENYLNDVLDALQRKIENKERGVNLTKPTLDNWVKTLETIRIKL